MNDEFTSVKSDQRYRSANLRAQEAQGISEQPEILGNLMHGLEGNRGLNRLKANWVSGLTLVIPNRSGVMFAQTLFWPLCGHCSRVPINSARQHGHILPMKIASQISRRRFVSAVATGAAALSFPRVLTAQKSDKQLVIGEGEHRYEVLHNWAQLPDKYTWQTTHNVAVDREGLLYVIHEGRENQKDHPSIFVFDGEGKFVRAFGNQFQGGGHGLEVRTEGREQFLYVTGYQQLKNFAKLTLKGEPVWEKRAPMDSKIYPAEEDTKPTKRWGRDAFMPTNYAFLPDGSFYLADGYGSYRIHRYDKDGNWKSMFGEPGKGDGQFNTPHGIWIDNRPGREASVVIADRANKRLQWFTLEGKHIKTLGGFMLPANIDSHKD